jgi:hypothetical protein
LHFCIPLLAIIAYIFTIIWGFFAGYAGASEIYENSAKGIPNSFQKVFDLIYYFDLYTNRIIYPWHEFSFFDIFKGKYSKLSDPTLQHY